MCNQYMQRQRSTGAADARAGAAAFFARRKRHVQFSVSEDAALLAPGAPSPRPPKPGAAVARWQRWQRWLRHLAPASAFSTGRDHARCLLCLYELWALSLRLAIGTAYGRLGPCQCGSPRCNIRCYMAAFASSARHVCASCRGLPRRLTVRTACGLLGHCGRVLLHARVCLLKRRWLQLRFKSGNRVLTAPGVKRACEEHVLSTRSSQVPLV